MTTSNNMLETSLNALHASDDLADRALARAAGKRRRSRRTHTIAGVAAASLALALATGGTAYAVVNSDFFAQAFGGHGMESGDWTWADQEGGEHAVSRDLTPISPADVSEDLAAAVEDVNLSAAANGYTLTIENMVLDANGAGIVTFNVTGENGVQDLIDAVGSNGSFWSSERAGINGLSMSMGDGLDWSLALIDTYVMFDADASTSDEFRGTMYFSAFGGVDEYAGGVSWSITTDDGNSYRTEVFMPNKVIEAVRLVDESGNSLSVSPLSVKSYDVTDVYDDVSLTLSMADGSEFAVYSNAETLGLSDVDVVNYFTNDGGWTEDGASCGVQTFSQLIDVTQVIGATVSGMPGWPDDTTVVSRAYSLVETVE